MDSSYCVETLGRVSIPLEFVLDLALWVVRIATTFWVLRLTIIRHPRTCLAVAAAWMGWLGWQVCFVSGYSALEATQMRLVVALGVTDRFAQDLFALVKAWIDFALPFLSDLLGWAIDMWRRLTVRQRLVVSVAMPSVYAVVHVVFETVRVFRRHELVLKKVIFHTSFLVGGPLVWYLCGALPTDWLPWCVSHAITTMPTFLSLLVLSHREQPHGTPTPMLGMQRLWLSYWACWPALAFLEAASAMATVPNNRHADIQRGLLTFVIWLQYWQGSLLFNLALRGILSRAGFLENTASLLGGKHALKLLGLVRGGLGVTSSASLGGTRLIARMMRHLWLVAVLTTFMTLIFAAMVYVFYRFVSMISILATALLWCFAAADSSDTLSRRAEDFYSRKLAFWVLAMLWEFVTQLPYIGVVLRLFTPFVFSIWLIAGDTVLRHLVLPVFGMVREPVVAATSAMFSVCETSMSPRNFKAGSTKLITDEASSENQCNEVSDEQDDSGLFVERDTAHVTEDNPDSSVGGSEEVECNGNGLVCGSSTCTPDDGSDEGGDSVEVASGTEAALESLESRTPCDEATKPQCQSQEEDTSGLNNIQRDAKDEILSCVLSPK